MKTDLFQSCGHCWVFQIFWHIECIIFTASSFRIWNSSTGILSPPLVLFIVMLSKPTWLHIPGCLALGEWSHHSDYLGCGWFSSYKCHPSWLRQVLSIFSVESSIKLVRVWPKWNCSGLSHSQLWLIDVSYGKHRLQFWYLKGRRCCEWKSFLLEYVCCQNVTCHPSLQGLGPAPLQLLTYSTLWKEF